jgi:hypothetical protein
MSKAKKLVDQAINALYKYLGALKTNALETEAAATTNKYLS